MYRVMMACVFVASTANADPATIEAVKATKSGDSWRFDVTLSHPDTGWDHYADGWRVLTPDGDIIGTRVLHHPHVNEQPFTRSLSGVAIPEGITAVQIEAKDSVEGWGGETVMLELANPTYAR